MLEKASPSFLYGESQFDVIYRILFVHIRRDLYTEEFLLSLIR